MFTEEERAKFKQRFAAWKAGEKVYEAGKISDSLYYDTMERVAERNNVEWNKERRSEGSPELSVDEEFTRILNDNTYDYRGYYNKYPNGKGNAIDHWTDEFKTVYHPTFSVYSKYSGKKSLYNPEGVLGGRWDGERYIPAWGQKLPKYGGGKKAVAFRRTIVDDDAFYQRMQERQAQLDSPKVLYTRQNNNPVKFDEQGNLVDQVTGETGTMMLPEVRITPKRYDAYHSTFDPDVIRNFTDWLPVVGDIGTGIDIKNAIKNQNYLEASLLGGMAILPAPLAKGVNKAFRPLFNRTTDKLYESFVKAGREDLALRMLDDKAKRLNPVTKNNGEILTLYRGDMGKYNVINERSKNPVFLSTDKNYAEMYTSNRRFYTPDPEDEWARQAVDLSDINPDNVREFYGFGNVFNAAPHADINSAVAESFFNTNDYLVSKKLADDVWDKYLPYFKETNPDYDDFIRAVHAIRLKKPIPDDIPKNIYDDALRATAVENVDERHATDFIRIGRYSGNNKKNPNGYFRKKDIGKKPKYDGTYQSLINQDLWYEHTFDPKKINPLRTIKYDGLSGRDIPLSNEVDFWRESKGREFAFRKSNNVKLRAITRDDEGKLIPLSKRLNLKNPDIRFFLPYLIGGGVGYGAYNKYAE